MANKITKSEMDTIVRGGAISILGIDEKGTQIGTSTYAIPVETPEGVFYAKVAVTAAQRTDTKTNLAFNLDTAVKKYESELAEKAEKAGEKAEQTGEGCCTGSRKSCPQSTLRSGKGGKRSQESTISSG